ncbi:hypothetical protein, conserved [Eimeria tenella]|uniref:ER membrane protein complex subunit 4 n=1 Tax=Eimeria tenella TaxID=5802 RepID=U6KRY8_EIMTE|nr:hypothetical protein, conserved [Eimeria tenella]CDJ40736.1 hypothetical protein, conserved [Eimeria tenella]|eukprot:XP_013231486.1 hypothetical protein, conserved [Eimeria tenella]
MASAAGRCWDFTFCGAPGGPPESVENPPGFEFAAEGLEKETEFLGALRQQQQQQQQQVAACPGGSPRAASAGSPGAAAAAAPPAAAAAAAAPPLSEEAVALLQRKVWESAVAPAKALSMNLLMLYMGGGSGIFGVLIAVYALHSGVRTLLQLSVHFKPFADTPQLRFVALARFLKTQGCCRTSHAAMRSSGSWAHI